MPVGKLVLIIGYCLILLLSTAAWAETVSPAVPQNLRVAATPPSPVEPWFEDSFEGEPPKGWDSRWFTYPWHYHDTTDLQGAPPAGGKYAYRQYYPEMPLIATSADHITDTFISENHKFKNGDYVMFSLVSGVGGTLPTGINSNVVYVVRNTTKGTFQISYVAADGSVGAPRGFSDNGRDPFYSRHQKTPGRLIMEFGTSSPVPLVGEDQDFSFSYYQKYHPNSILETPPETNRFWCKVIRT